MKSIDRYENECLDPKRFSVSPRTRSWFTALLVLVFALALGGCSHYAKPGETASERGLRHRSVFRVNGSQMMDDIDKVLMLDRPSGLSEYRLP